MTGLCWEGPCSWKQLCEFHDCLCALEEQGHPSRPVFLHKVAVSLRHLSVRSTHLPREQRCPQRDHNVASQVRIALQPSLEGPCLQRIQRLLLTLGTTSCQCLPSTVVHTLHDLGFTGLGPINMNQSLKEPD